jgi:glycosyltransferase involved in cell wall biosynthesis
MARYIVRSPSAYDHPTRSLAFYDSFRRRVASLLACRSSASKGGSEAGLDEPFRVGVMLEEALEVGGGFQQSLNDLLWLRAWAASTCNEIIVFTPYPQSVVRLQKFGIEAQLLKPSPLDRIILFAKYAGPLDLLQRSLRMRAPLEKRLLENNIDLVHFASPSVWHMVLYKLPFTITIFDICHRDAPEFDEVREFGHFERREKLFSSASTKAVLVVANSAELIEDMGRCYGLDSNRAVCIPFSPSIYVTRTDTDAALADADVLRKYRLEPGYLFYPAQFWSHKNHAALLAAAALLRDKGSMHRLVFCGSDRGTRERINSLAARYGISDQVSIIGFVDSEELGALYRAATALVMPSYFGPANLPPLEAWTVGTPVIYPEAFKGFAGDAAILFDYDNPASLAEAITRAGPPEVRASLRRAGEVRLQHFAEQINAGRRQFADHMNRLKFRRKGSH